ncbi:MAG TPA: enolase C-terminal domain-like protein [Steroidobacteraceae bacterium]|nr:enolase C-terminal domain-like protein [Steroidobacteraceae bacterium]
MAPTLRDSQAPIERVQVRAYTVPTEEPESDGTLEWRATTLVLVSIAAGSVSGLGYSYADTATARLIHERLAALLEGKDALAINARWEEMVRTVRNLGSAGICAMGISAVDNALWDLKARLLGLPLVALLPAARASVPVYGSGGFTSYDIPRLQRQLAAWVSAGIPRVKMKVGRHPDRDRERVAAARSAIGEARLFVDANGAYPRKLALEMARVFAGLGVSWYEEPVSSDDLAGLRLIRDRAPAVMEVSAGEYGYDVRYFRRLCAAGAVDVLQADVTRCGGVTGFLRAAAIADAFLLPLSSHCAPALHAAVGCAAPCLRHLEYFHDHVRIERLLFDGTLEPIEGALVPDRTRPGFGLELKESDAERFAV